MNRSGSSKGFNLEAEARYATVLKCDVVNSTTSKQSLDLEGQLGFQRNFERIVADAAARYDAHIERFEGDGATVVLGFPKSREDGAEATIRLGFDLVDAVVNGQIIPGNQLQLRVGIASGTVAVLHRLSTSRGENIAGLTMDLAERLRASGDPGQIIVSDATKRLAGAFFRYDDLGLIKLKGFKEGIQAWRVSGVSDVVSRFDAQRLPIKRGEIVGRADVTERLNACWRSALAGQGQSVCLVGEPGIGKSRLARVVVDAATLLGASILQIHCLPSAGNTPLFPVGVFLRAAAGIMPDCSRPEIARLAKELLRRFMPEDEIAKPLFYLGPLFGLDGEPIREGMSPTELRDATIAIFQRMSALLAAERPLLILCEDLHWADDTTATVMGRICEHIRDLRAMVIATSRPSGQDLSLSLPGAIGMSLGPLSDADAADLVKSVAQDHPLPAEVVQHIVHRCEGVPLLLEEVTRDAVESARYAETTRPGERQNSEVPTSLQLIVQSRLTRHPGLAASAQAASVLGRDFSVRLLEGLLKTPRRKVAETLDLLSAEGLLTRSKRVRDQRVRFRHIMICEAVYDTLLGSDRQRLHSAAADLLLRPEFANTPDAAADIVAEHLCKSNRFLEAVRMRVSESARTAALGAYVETEGHCSSALSIIDSVTDNVERNALKFRLLVQLGVALTGRYGYAAETVEKTYRQAHSVCGDGAEAEMLYPIMRGLATVNLVRGNLAAAYELSMQGLNLAERSNCLEFRIDALSVLGYTTFYFRRLDQCRDWIERCLALYRSEQGHLLVYPVPQDAATAALALLPTVAWLLGDPKQAERAVQEGLAHVESLNREFDKALLHCWIAGTRLTQRRFAEAIEHAGVAVAISERHGYREWHATGGLVYLLAKACLRADPQAIAQASEACAEFARAGVGLNASYYLWALSLGCLQAGDKGTARELISKAFQVSQTSHDTRMHAELSILQAEMEPDDSCAAVMLDRALRLAETQGDLTTALRAAAGLILRSGAEEASVASARATLALLNGTAGRANEPDWIVNRLPTLKRAARSRQHVAACS